MEAWDAARVDNDTLLEQWEVRRDQECHNGGEKVPPKPHVAKPTAPGYT